MIHNENTLNIKQYSLYDRTSKLRYLKKWYNILPTIFFRKRLEAFAFEIHRKLGGSEVDNAFEKEIHKINSIDKIQLLIALYQAVYNLLENLDVINQWKGLIGLKKTEAKNLKEYTRKIKKYTGYTIENKSDLKKLNSEIERRTEKFAEIFPDTEKEDKKGATFMQIYMGVISVMGIQFNYKMVMADFFEAKEDAYNRIKKQESNARS